jgi:glycosyltransferase involved in cell wall biosynthesis
MKIYLPNHSEKVALGGGWTFQKNFINAVKEHVDMQIVRDMRECDIYFIAGSSMVTPDEVDEAKRMGKKIVLRVDNMPRNSRNRNTGSSRLKKYADMADLVVYQSNWAKFYLSPFIGKQGSVIINGADDSVFQKEGTAQVKDGSPQYTFIQYNRDETKQWHQAWYHYIIQQRIQPNAHLWIIGRFSPENIEYNFDFFSGERFRYVGILEEPRDIAEYLRATDVLLLPYFNDACSNTLIEARMCGVKEVWHNQSGGNSEIMNAQLHDLTSKKMVEKYFDEFCKIMK